MFSSEWFRPTGEVFQTDVFRLTGLDSSESYGMSSQFGRSDGHAFSVAFEDLSCLADSLSFVSVGPIGSVAFLASESVEITVRFAESTFVEHSESIAWSNDFGDSNAFVQSGVPVSVAFYESHFGASVEVLATSHFSGSQFIENNLFGQTVGIVLSDEFSNTITVYSEVRRSGGFVRSGAMTSQAFFASEAMPITDPVVESCRFGISGLLDRSLLFARSAVVIGTALVDDSLVFERTAHFNYSPRLVLSFAIALSSSLPQSPLFLASDAIELSVFPGDSSDFARTSRCGSSQFDGSLSMKASFHFDSSIGFEVSPLLKSSKPFGFSRLYDKSRFFEASNSLISQIYFRGTSFCLSGEFAVSESFPDSSVYPLSDQHLFSTIVCDSFRIFPSDDLSDSVFLRQTELDATVYMLDSSQFAPSIFSRTDVFIATVSLLSSKHFETVPIALTFSFDLTESFSSSCAVLNSAPVISHHISVSERYVVSFALRRSSGFDIRASDGWSRSHKFTGSDFARDVRAAQQQEEALGASEALPEWVLFLGIGVGALFVFGLVMVFVLKKWRRTNSASSDEFICESEISGGVEVDDELLMLSNILECDYEMGSDDGDWVDSMGELEGPEEAFS
jgi:hypothetical protein